jgi:hypothetical protein
VSLLRGLWLCALTTVVAACDDLPVFPLLDAVDAGSAEDSVEPSDSGVDAGQPDAGPDAG